MRTQHLTLLEAIKAEEIVRKLGRKRLATSTGGGKQSPAMAESPRPENKALAGHSRDIVARVEAACEGLKTGDAGLSDTFDRASRQAPPFQEKTRRGCFRASLTLTHYSENS